jgi:hypothetical protein
MVTNRRIAIYVIAITTVLAITCFPSLWNSINGSLFSDPVPWLWIDAQFEEGCLNVTMKNNDNRDYIISEVMLCRSSAILAGVLVREPISVGEQFSICISFNWTSGYEYGIRVRTTDGKGMACYMYAP